jgi:adenylate kinase family enzyme
MKRVMIIGQPGSGKAWLARRMGEITHLPVVHIDAIHWAPGWAERPRAEKDRLCAGVHARPEWIFEGGHSSTWEARLDRADTVIWLDLPLGLRLRRVLWRSLCNWGRSRPELPPGCPERFNGEFVRYIWRTRRSQRSKLRWFYGQVPEDKDRHHLRSRREVADYLGGLSEAVASGNLGLPHR